MESAKVAPEEVQPAGESTRTSTGGERLSTQVSNIWEKKAAANEAQGQAFLNKEAAKPGAVKTDSGMVMSTIKAGTGPSPS